MTLTAEQLEIQALARAFADGEVRPRSAAWDEARALDDDVFAKLAETGFLGLTVAEAHGGLDLDPTTYLLVLEELARGDAAVALAVAIHNGPVASLLARHGTDAQRAALLPALAAGERLGVLAISEPDAGSDIAAVATRAVPDGDGWRLSGTKRWVTGGGRAGLAIVLARAGGGEDGALDAFLVELPAAGWRVTGRESTMGLRAADVAAVELDGVRVGADRRLGGAGAGFRLAMEALDVGRVGVAAQAVGIARAACEHAADYALAREQFGQPIARFGAIQEKLADMVRRVAAARLLAHEAGRRMEGFREGRPLARGPDSLTAWAAMAKLTATEAAMWVTDEAVQVFGGYGYMRDYPVEKLMRDAKGTEIYEGTSEIMRLVIARETLRKDA